MKKNQPTKTAFAKYQPDTKKRVKIQSSKSPESAAKKKPIWNLKLFDLEGPWGVCKINKASTLEEIRIKLSNYSTMTWAQIEGDLNHSIEISSCIKKAQKRLIDLQLDDISNLFSFRFSGKKRLYGKKQNEIFFPVWWDPDHEICPSKLKHT